MDCLDTSEENIKKATTLLNKAIAVCSATNKKTYYTKAVDIIEDQKLWEFVTTHHSDCITKG
jgi:hypothetical protein